MKNREIIEYIDRYCAQKKDFDTYLNTDLAFAILAHGYLYVRSYELLKEFTSNVMEAIKVGTADGFDLYRGGKTGLPLDSCIRISMASTALEVARNMFDNEYFEEQSASLDLEEECDSTLLDKYLNLMNKEQLCSFIDDVSSGLANYAAFSDYYILNELNERCRKVNTSIPATMSGYNYFSFRQENPYYLFDYLSRKEIIDAIKCAIVRNKSLAGHLARMTYHDNNFGLMDYCAELIVLYERVFSRDIYDPEIFDESIYM